MSNARHQLIRASAVLVAASFTLFAPARNHLAEARRAGANWVCVNPGHSCSEIPDLEDWDAVCEEYYGTSAATGCGDPAATGPCGGDPGFRCDYGESH